MLDLVSKAAESGKPVSFGVILGFFGVAVIIFFIMAPLRAKAKKQRGKKMSDEEKKLKDFWDGYERKNK